jgi:hypothetical protein
MPPVPLRFQRRRTYLGMAMKLPTRSSAGTARRKRAPRNTTTDEQHDVLVPDSQVAVELGGVSRMTIFRWDRDPAKTGQGFPPRIMLNGRGYRSRQELEKFKANLMRKALAARDEVA